MLLMFVGGNSAKAMDQESYQNQWESAFWGLDYHALLLTSSNWIKDFPSDPLALQNSAWLIWRFGGNIDSALGFLDSAIAINSACGECYQLKARLLWQSERLDLASSNYQEALSIDPENDRLRAEYLRLLIQTHKYTTANAIAFENAPKRPLADVSLAMNRVYLAIRDGEYEKAATALASLQILSQTELRDSRTQARWNALSSCRARKCFAERAEFLHGQHHYRAASLEYQRAALFEKSDELNRLADLLERLGNDISDYYKDRARFGPDVESELWPRLATDIDALGKIIGVDASADKPEERVRATFKAFEEAEHWVAVIAKTNGILDLHIGPITWQGSYQINQWNQSTSIGVVALMDMLSNGFSGWFWDGAAEDGGWIAAGADGSLKSRRFVQVMDPKFGAAASRVKILADKEKRSDAVTQWSEVVAREIDSNRYSEELDAMLRVRALQPFIKENAPQFDAANSALIDHFITTSTLIHEGQHVLDALNGFQADQWILEYRAKLTEIHYGALPFQPLSDFYKRAAVAGEASTPHAEAETFLIRRLHDALAANAQAYASPEIKNIGLALLPQLKDQELRNLAKELFCESFDLVKKQPPGDLCSAF